MTQRRYQLTIAYDGTDFHGWQIQHPPGEEPLRTVQGVLREAVIRAVKQPVHVQGASRTDAGVHALGQVAHFDADTPIPVERLGMAINSRLPQDVEVRDVRIVANHFNATSCAIDKQYRYRIWLGDDRPLGLRHQVFRCRTRGPLGQPPLDIDRMNDAAARLVGEHDFEQFCSSKHGRLSTVRTIHTCAAQWHSDYNAPGAPEVHVVVSGNGFLYNMVRIIAGTLIEVGRGHWEPGKIDEMLAVADHTVDGVADGAGVVTGGAQKGPTLPPEGLCLEWVRYPEEVLTPVLEEVAATDGCENSED